jgi:hypothetical protein
MKRLTFVLAIAACGAGSTVLRAGECVLDSSVLSTVVVDLASDNYAALLASLETSVGPTLVTCALQAVESSAVTADAGAAPAVKARAHEMLVKRGVEK